jgi:hypothetical protein
VKRPWLVIAGLSVLVAALVLSSCGSSKSKRLTREEYASKANALCQTYRSQISALGTPTTDAEAITMSETALTDFKNLVSGLKKLTPPTADEATANQINTVMARMSGRLASIIDAMKANDKPTFTRLAGENTPDKKKSQTLLGSLGATTCVSALEI